MTTATTANPSDAARAHCDAGTPWHAVFPPADRHDAAAMLVEHLEGEWQAGNSWGA